MFNLIQFLLLSVKCEQCSCLYVCEGNTRTHTRALRALLFWSLTTTEYARSLKKLRYSAAAAAAAAAGRRLRFTVNV